MRHSDLNSRFIPIKDNPKIYLNILIDGKLFQRSDSTIHSFDHSRSIEPQNIYVYIEIIMGSDQLQ